MGKTRKYESFTSNKKDEVKKLAESFAQKQESVHKINYETVYKDGKTTYTACVQYDVDEAPVSELNELSKKDVVSIYYTRFPEAPKSHAKKSKDDLIAILEADSEEE